MIAMAFSLREGAKTMIIGVPKESCPGERRVALIPASLMALSKVGMEVLVEEGAGLDAGFTDAEYVEKGAKVVSRDEVFSKGEIVLQVRCFGANLEAGKADLPKMRKGQILIGTGEPLSELDAAKELAATGVTHFALELVPRITRAQSMDILSSMATVAGYKAVVLATNHLPRMFPMMMTAAGTVAPARVFVIGAGVAGLQAIASAKKAGAKVLAYDIRPAVKEQIESLGGKFLEMDLGTKDAEDKGGYAKEQTDDDRKKQQDMMKAAIADSDVVITTAAVPGRKAPILVTQDMVEGMVTGSVVVDLAAERGGNVDLTQPGENIVHKGVTILGPSNLPSTVPYHASQMYAKNTVTFLLNMLDKEGRLEMDLEDEIIKDTLVCKDGEVVNTRMREMMGLSAPTTEGSGA